MLSTPLLLLLHLVLFSVVSASHHYGGVNTYSYGGKSSNGTFIVHIRNRATFDGCGPHQSMYCYNGSCGWEVYSNRSVLDSSTNTPIYNRKWCEAETVTTRHLTSNKPFSLRSASCCWIPTRNYLGNWRLLTTVDLGTRSDTGVPNTSPVIGTLPFLRVPQNCPRTYQMLAFDPDGDRVRCRYGLHRNTECSSCTQPAGFQLDEDTCTLCYNYTNSDPRVFGFELVVEDFPQQPITLVYSDGSHSYRPPLTYRGKRAAWATPSPGHPWSSWQNTTRNRTTTPQSWSHWNATTGQPWSRWSTTTSQPWSHWNATTGQPSSRLLIATRHRTTTTHPWSHRNSTTEGGTTARHPHTRTPPLGKLPLQFSLLVDPPVPSCQEGLYLPTLVYPTPRNGERIHAEINKEVAIRVKALASYTTIHDIITSGPKNMKKYKNTHDEFVLRWTPRPGDIGGHHPLCFAVESITWSAQTTPQPYYYDPQYNTPPPTKVYQSEMRCVLLDVRNETIKATVICTESNMTVAVSKTSLHGIHLDRLHLSDSANIDCNLQTHSNSTHIVAIVPLNSCGTQLEEDDENLIFKNEINSVDNFQDTITRKNRLELDFCCQYAKRGNVTQSFTAHRKNVTVWEKGFGIFTYQFEFFPNVWFKTMISPSLYPLEYDLKSRIYMKIEASTSLNNTELFVESCKAAPYDNPNYRPTYTIIENGCTVDPTLLIHPPAHKREFRFSLEAFKFIGLHDQVYISCSVLVCEAGVPSTRCSRGCINSTWPGQEEHHYRKREAAIQSANHFVSQGPLRLKKSAESDGSTALNLNLNLVFIAGCLLAVVGMISTVVIYKAKMSRVKYQPLPTFDS
ncbi:uncharacterized protein LOC129179067 isoform X2 [Dunckerocampus dactyliophorus]|uniref:uncharacterized protein LOC129179067 isoform X2 n=1 Tax=Dunckerocampus dactyliophorus TaxID=161453 RepID=UPI002405E5E6|nr:uncharacterized protein LOC129179067 isoform X2 [Dunckerocampus dactyliophorus]